MEKKNTKISVRLGRFITKVSENPNSFAKKIGYIRTQTIYDILNEKHKPNLTFIERLANAEISKSLNLNWLLTGNGEMIINNEKKEPRPRNQTVKDLLDFIKEKDKTIVEQAEEIGRLKEMLYKKEGGAFNAENGEIADVG